MNRILFVVAACILFVTPTAFASEGMVGLFIAHKSKDGAAYEKWYELASPVLKSYQCKTFRKGRLFRGNGSLPWDQANRFTILECELPVLAELVTKGLYSSLTNVAHPVSMIEGDLKPLSGPGPSKASEYIIKISYYNNLKKMARNEMLSDIGEQASKIDGAWVDDAVLIPTASVGIIRPDELSFIYYPEVGQGEIFRKENPKMLKKIGAFNQEYLTHYIYLDGLLSK